MSLDPIKSATEMVKKVRVSTVLSSLLWVLPFLIAGLIVVSFTSNLLIQKFFMWLIGIDFGSIVLSYFGVLLFGDKKYLQSEEHIFMMRALEVLGDQQHIFKDFKSAELGNNPSFPKPEVSDLLSVDKIEKQNYE